MTLTQIRRDVAEMRDGVVDPNLKGVLRAMVKRLVPGVRRVTLEGITLTLRVEGNRVACQGRDVLAAWMYDTGRALQSL